MSDCGVVELRTSPLTAGMHHAGSSPAWSAQASPPARGSLTNSLMPDSHAAFPTPIFWLPDQKPFKRCPRLGERGRTVASLRTPVIIVNFKTYEGCFGRQAVSLARIVDSVAQDTGVSLAIAPNNIDIYRISQEVNIPVLAQHVSPITPGSHTGHVLAKAVKEAGAAGTLLNHAEKTRSLEIIEETIARCRENGLVTVVCADTIEQAKKIASLGPDMVAIEPPGLIGGEVSVTTANPGLLTQAVSEVPGLPLLCGAGVKTGEDVATAVRLGMQGVLLASGVVLASDPQAALMGLVSSLERGK